MAPEEDNLVATVLFNFYAHLLTLLCLIFLLVLKFDTSHSPNVKNRFLIWNTQRSAFPQNTLYNLNSDDNGTSFIEYKFGQYFQDARENCPWSCFCTALRANILEVFSYHVKEMVYYICREYCHSHLISHLFCFCVSLDIECQNYSILFTMFTHHGSFHHIFFMHRTNSKSRNWNFHVFKELQESLKRSKGARLNIHTLP
mmetsp:Transcript_7385/g.10345  ORF Transcript_7385/g.10345 Transcript_7385/m.10345 type:complete len:200 (+) Transcript_7385:408-1007(+)